MSRDFLISCGTPERAAAAARILAAARADDGELLFEVDNRGSDLFVMFVYAHDIDAAAGCSACGRRVEGLRSHVVFVALKNGEHDGLGYLVDTGRRLDPKAKPIALASIPALVASYLLGDSQPFGTPPFTEA